MVFCTPYFWVILPITPFMFCCQGEKCRKMQGRPGSQRPPPPPRSV